MFRNIWRYIKSATIDLSSKGIFQYIGSNVLKIFLIYGIAIGLLLLTDTFLFDFDRFFKTVLESLPDQYVLPVYFLSESTLGLIPGEILVIWSLKYEWVLLFLLIIGTISYAGGFAAYGIGRFILKRPGIRKYIEQKLERYIQFSRKWGNAFIVVAALFPFSPFPLVVLALSLLHYPFRSYLFFGLIRILRFLIQGIFFFNVLNIDQWIF
jgi:membrane protein YqaA with SNARE-associated domain